MGGLTAGGREKVRHVDLVYSNKACCIAQNKPFWLILNLGRRAHLELILPRAQQFQEEVDDFQQWLMSIEQKLAELRNAERVMLHLTDATERAKVRNLSDMLLNHNIMTIVESFESPYCI